MHGHLAHATIAVVRGALLVVTAWRGATVQVATVNYEHTNKR